MTHVRYAIIMHRDQDARNKIAQRAAAVRLLRFAGWGSADIYCDSGKARLLGTRSCAIGRVFGMEKGAAHSIEPSFATLVREFWGAYVAICAGVGGRISILRDPSGMLSCYYQTIDGGLVIAPTIGLLEHFTGVRPALSWSDVERCLRGGDMPTSSTALRGVVEIMPGQALHWSPDRLSCDTFWHPLDYVDTRASNGVERQATHLRDTVTRVIAHLSAEAPKILTTVSGGLDSSIVTSALSSAGREVTCLTMASHDPSGDERQFAQRIAAHCASPLIEAFFDRRDVDLAVSHANLLPRPVGRPFAQSVDALVERATAQCGAEAVYHGTGGDNVFGMLQSAAPVADRILRRDMIGAVSTARDVARLNHVSVARALAGGARIATRWRGTYRWQTNERFLTASPLLEALPCNDWLRADKTHLPGQLGRIALLLRIRNYIESQALGGAREAIAPLLAQPIVELCLAIPSWQWCDGGRDRAVARKAFAADLPQALLKRRWKGGPDAFVGELVEANRAFLIERLCDGALAERGLIDRNTTRFVLTDPRPPTASDALRLLALADAEAWVRARV